MTLEFLPAREREIAGIIFARGKASAAEICESLSDPISNAAVRSMLRRLQRKRVIARHPAGKKYIYTPALSDSAVRREVLRRVADICFDGSFAEVQRELKALELSEEVMPMPVTRAIPAADMLLKQLTR